MKAFLVKFFAQAAPSVLAWALNLAVPVIPAPVWLALIKGLLAGDLTLEHISQFLKDHNIKTYPDYDIKKNNPFDTSPDINTIPSFKSGGDNP